MASAAFAGPVLTGPVLTEPVCTEPVLTEPVLTEPVLTEPVLAGCADRVLVDVALAGSEIARLSPSVDGGFSLEPVSEGAPFGVPAEGGWSFILEKTNHPNLSIPQSYDDSMTIDRSAARGGERRRHLG